MEQQAAEAPAAVERAQALLRAEGVVDADTELLAAIYLDTCGSDDLFYAALVRRPSSFHRGGGMEGAGRVG
eukprot:m51a1_g13201 hypothetical protein (71) ;mRNA; f:2074-2286